MSERRKPVPDLRDEAEARAFWERHDSSEYVDWDAAARVRFPNLKPSNRSISLNGCHRICLSVSRSPPTSATCRTNR